MSKSEVAIRRDPQPLSIFREGLLIESDGTAGEIYIRDKATGRLVEGVESVTWHIDMDTWVATAQLTFTRVELRAKTYLIDYPPRPVLYPPPEVLRRYERQNY